MDPRSAHTKQSLEAQFALSEKIYDTWFIANSASTEIVAALRAGKDLPFESRAELQAIVGTFDPGDRPDMGLQQAQTALAADMASVRTGDREPTGQEQELFRLAEASVKLRLEQWNRFKAAKASLPGAHPDAHAGGEE